MFNRVKTVASIGLFSILVLLFVAGCTGLPLEAKWGDISAYGNPTQIIFAFANQVVSVDPLDGSPTELRNDEGQVLLDDQGNPRAWRIQIGEGGPNTFYTQPVVLDEETLLVAGWERRIFEADGPTARILNGTGTQVGGHIVATPVLNGDLLYIPYSEANLAAYDVSSASAIWTFTTERGLWASPLLVEDQLLIPSMDHNLYSVDPQTGELLWTLDLGGAVADTPVLHDGYLYAGSFGRKIFKIDLSGQIVAEFPTTEWVWSAPAIVDGMVYAADLGGNVYALTDDGESFTQVWSRQVAQRGIRAVPLVTEDAVIVASRDHNVYWVSRETGEELVRREMRGEVLSDMLLLEPSESLNLRDPLVIVSSLAREERLVAFTLDNGERRWVYAQ